jgi:hypothetical protein
MRARPYPDEQSARQGVKDGELVVAVKRSDGVVEWGVIPALVELDQGEGREPVRQPAGEFLASWWSEIQDQVNRERE